MSYCVHCGVKLGTGETRCPLCQTPVIDPAAPADPAAPRAYPVRTPEQELKRNRKYLLSLLAILLLIPALLCLVTDLLSSQGLSWSIYAAGALGLLFLTAAAPLLFRKHRALLSILAAFLSLNAYLFMAQQVSGSRGWYVPIVLPALALATGMTGLLIALYQRDRLNKLTLLAACLFAVAVQCLAVEWLCARAAGPEIRFMWSPYAVGPCVFVSLLLFFINGSRPIREEVRRRVHF